MTAEKRLTGRLRRIPLNAAGVVSVVLALLLASPLGGCYRTAFMFYVPPSLPIGYYQCIEARPEDLYSRYLSQSSRRVNADVLYTNNVYVFKNVKFVDGMKPINYPNCIWIFQVICYAASPQEMARLKHGRYYDIIGVCRGFSKEWRDSIYLTECYFLPAGTVVLPAEDIPALPSGGY